MTTTLQQGRITAGAKIRGVAYKMATSGKNPIMTMFWLKTRAKWSNEMRLEDVSTRRSYYEPIDWDDAFAMVAEELNGLASPDEATFYTSGRTSNEAASTSSG